MRAMYRALSNFFFLFSVVLFGLAAYAYFAPAAGPSLAVAATEIDVPDCAPGRETEVAVRMENTSGKPMRILGLAEC
jgi:hypothetical protein